MLENQRLKSEFKRLQDTKWSVAKIKDDDGMAKFYTGLPSFAVFLWLFKYDLKLGSTCLNVNIVQHLTTTFCSDDMILTKYNFIRSKMNVLKMSKLFASLIHGCSF